MITLDDVVGLERQKEQLSDLLLLPLQKKDLYEAIIQSPEKVKRQNNILLSGPPGTGKTYLAKAIAAEANLACTVIQSTELLNRYVGQGAKNLREAYDINSGIIFLDEIDAIASSRTEASEAKNDMAVELLFCLEKKGPYATLAATNRLDALDPAVRSRFDVILEFPSPCAKQRKAILEKHLSYYMNDVASLESMVHLTEGYDGRQLQSFVRAASVQALKADRNYITQNDFSLEYRG